jgi:hypothetical protein
MKKIFTLLFATAMLSTAFAQYGQKDQRDRTKENDVYVSNDNRGYDKNDNDFDRYDKGYGRGAYIFTAREKNMQIAQINREYDYKIQSVRSRFGIGWYQKKRIINNLEEQRENEIRQVMFKFNSPKNKFGDYGRRDKKRW